MQRHAREIDADDQVVHVVQAVELEICGTMNGVVVRKMVRWPSLILANTGDVEVGPISGGLMTLHCTSRVIGLQDPGPRPQFACLLFVPSCLLRWWLGAMSLAYGKSDSPLPPRLLVARRWEMLHLALRWVGHHRSAGILGRCLMIDSMLVRSGTSYFGLREVHFVFACVDSYLSRSATAS